MAAAVVVDAAMAAAVVVGATSACGLDRTETLTASILFLAPESKIRELFFLPDDAGNGRAPADSPKQYGSPRKSCFLDPGEPWAIEKRPRVIGTVIWPFVRYSRFAKTLRRTADALFPTALSFD